MRTTGRGFCLPIGKDEILRRIGVEYVRDVHRRGMQLKKSEFLKRQASEVARFLTEERYKYGLFICGRVGNGKSTIARAIKKVVNEMVSDGMLTTGEIFQWDYMAIVDAREMVKTFIRDNEEFRLLKSRRFLIIDDLGTDQKNVSLYGTVFNPFMELLDYRYEMLLPTIIVSNLTAPGLVEKYDDPRLADRMNEMFEIISFEDNSFRI